jgi:hypothetical protein
MPRRARLTRSLVCVFLATIGGAAVAVSAPSCTIFNGLSFDGGAASGSGGNTSTSSGSAGSGGMPHTPLHYLSMPDAAKFCSRIAECPEPLLIQSTTNSVSVPLDPTNYSFCMTWIAGPIPADRIGVAYQRSVLECITNAADCDAANACSANEFYQGNDPRCAGELDAGLDSGAEQCVDNGNAVQRCDLLDGLHCDNGYFSSSKCLLGDDGTRWCASATNCSITAQCVGSILEYCGAPSNLEFSIDCSTLGLTCGLDAKTQIVDCLTDGKRNVCATDTSQCDGPTAQVCNYEYYSPFHCAELGGTCDASHGNAFCRRTGDACTPFDADVNTCAGTKVKLCVGGQNVDFDCKSIGKTCTVSPAVGCH